MASQEERKGEQSSKEEQTKEPPSEESLLVEEKINQLDQIAKAFTDGEIDGLRMYNLVAKFWDEVNQDPILKPKIEAQIKKLRVQLHQVAPLDISKHGDPVRRRYTPREWLGRMPPEFKGKEDLFVLDKIGSLRDFFIGLKPEKEKSSKSKAQD